MSKTKRSSRPKMRRVLTLASQPNGLPCILTRCRICQTVVCCRRPRKGEAARTSSSQFLMSSRTTGKSTMPAQPTASSSASWSARLRTWCSWTAVARSDQELFALEFDSLLETRGWRKWHARNGWNIMYRRKRRWEL